MRVTASFIRSAASASDLPQDGLAEIAFVGRSNVGKSTLINALVRQRVARTSAAAGKTRLANIYRVQRGSAPALYLVDLPGYGYARGWSTAAREFDELTRAYFGRVGRVALPARVAALLVIDARHPGLESDLEAWRWLQETVERCAIVATKIDKLSRAERQRAMKVCEAVCEYPVLPVSAVTGEGLEDLWILIDRLANQPRPKRRSRQNPASKVEELKK